MDPFERQMIAVRFPGEQSPTEPLFYWRLETDEEYKARLIHANLDPKLARKFHVSPDTVSSALNQITWRNL